MEYSIVLPVYEEADSLRELYAELSRVMGEIGGDAEMIFVDDGSRDGSAGIIEHISRGDPRVKLLRLRSHMGKSAAYSAGFDASRGRIVVTMDADLQDDPGELPKLLAELEKGFDLVVGRKRDRLSNEPVRTLSSRVFNHLTRLCFSTRLHDHNSGFRAMRREVVRNLELYGDFYRFIPPLSVLRGFRVTEVDVRHRRRRHGRSKYGPSRFWTSLMDLISVRFLAVFSQRPLHFFGTLAAIPLLAGIGIEFYVLVRKWMGGMFRTHIAAIIIGALLIMVGIQILATGLIGEMLTSQSTARRYRLINDSPGPDREGETS